MANLTGLTTNFFPTASETYANNLSASISALAATVSVNSANEYADGDVATLTVDAGTASEATFTGVKASTPARFTNCVWTEGNLGVGHASGATVIDYDSATHMSQVSKGMLVEHKQSGQHRNINADSVTINGSLIATGDVTEQGTTARVFRDESLADFVASGGVWSIAAGLNGAMTIFAGYITGYRSSILAVASRAFTASKDTYVDVLRTTVGNVTTFSLVYTEVAVAAAAPALAANSLRLAIVTTSGVAITAIRQSGWDSLGNPVSNMSPDVTSLGTASRTGTMSGFSAENLITQVIVLVPAAAALRRELAVKIVIPQVYSSVTGDRFTVRIKEDGVLIQQYYGYCQNSHGWCGSVDIQKVSPSAGSHTYSATMERDSGTGTLTCYAVATSPMQISVDLK